MYKLVPALVAITSPRMEGAHVSEAALERMTHNELVALAGVVDLVKLRVQAAAATAYAHEAPARIEPFQLYLGTPALPQA